MTRERPARVRPTTGCGVRCRTTRSTRRSASRVSWTWPAGGSTSALPLASTGRRPKSWTQATASSTGIAQMRPSLATPPWRRRCSCATRALAAQPGQRGAVGPHPRRTGWATSCRRTQPMAMTTRRRPDRPCSRHAPWGTTTATCAIAASRTARTHTTSRSTGTSLKTTAGSRDGPGVSLAGAAAGWLPGLLSPPPAQESPSRRRTVRRTEAGTKASWGSREWPWPHGAQAQGRKAG
mmetsp:Transcript_137028/g.382056  ORF Transcript_137028/g.382056 Transcript_137028/m.382056 type:complete len:237 (-) Transcript_137028:53-763(-)